MPEKTERTLDDIIADVVDPMAEKLLENEYPDPPPNLMVPVKVWRESKKKELMNKISGADVRERVKLGMNLTFDYIKNQLPQVDSEKIINEWKEGSKNFAEFLKNKGIAQEDLLHITDENDPDLEEIMKISNETIEHIYAAGARQFQDKLYKEASAVFTVLVILNNRRHNVWLSLGLSLQNNQQIELALQALDMAVLTNPDDPMSYIYSAECCLEERKINEAKEFLEKAQESADRSPDTSDGVKSYINNLKNNCN